jgi:hypothetical protein
MTAVDMPYNFNGGPGHAKAGFFVPKECKGTNRHIFNVVTTAPPLFPPPSGSTFAPLSLDGSISRIPALQIPIFASYQASSVARIPSPSRRPSSARLLRSAFPPCKFKFSSSRSDSSSFHQSRSARCFSRQVPLLKTSTPSTRPQLESSRPSPHFSPLPKHRATPHTTARPFPLPPLLTPARREARSPTHCKSQTLLLLLPRPIAMSLRRSKRISRPLLPRWTSSSASSRRTKTSPQCLHRRWHWTP